jgi:protein-S-isoprenylcysteine O-methyltransferase Ste14
MRPLPPLLVVICLAVMAILTLVAPGPRILAAPWTWLGAAVALLGLALAVSGAGLFRRLGTNIKTFDDPDLLVTSGLFRISRNPMYLGFLLLLAGVALLIGRATPVLPVLVFFLAAQFWYIPFEERAMSRRFGSDYASYRARVRRWI